MRIKIILLPLLLISCISEQPPAADNTQILLITETTEPESEPILEEPEMVPPMPEPEPSEHEFTVTEEVYNQTFSEIEDLIRELNSVISRRQFDRWLNYLSLVYIRTFESREVLDKINEFPQLKNNGIVLRDLRGYFNWVVVPSRSRAVLDEIIFTGEHKVIAYSSFEGEKAKLYELEQIEGDWKVTIWL